MRRVAESISGVAAVAAVLLAAATGPAAAQAVESTAPQAAPSGAYHRVIAFSPGITEIVYALGGQDRLVGIASFSDYPPQAAEEKTVVGGILNVDTERILALKPDLIITPPGAMAQEKLEHLGVKVTFVADKTLADVEGSFVTVGRLVGREPEGEALAKRLRETVAAAQKRNTGKPRLRTLIVIGYDPLWVAGGYGSVDELLAAAGGGNAAGKVRKDFYLIDAESVVAARPELIVDLTLRDSDPQPKRDAAKAFWKRFSTVPAAANGRIEFIDIDILTIPGPRLLDGLRALEKALHPTDKSASDPDLHAAGGLEGGRHG